MNPTLASLIKPEILSVMIAAKRHLFLIRTKVPCEPAAALVTLGWRSWGVRW